MRSLLNHEEVQGSGGHVCNSGNNNGEETSPRHNVVEWHQGQPTSPMASLHICTGWLGTISCRCLWAHGSLAFSQMELEELVVEKCEATPQRFHFGLRWWDIASLSLYKHNALWGMPLLLATNRSYQRIWALVVTRVLLHPACTLFLSHDQLLPSIELRIIVTYYVSNLSLVVTVN